MGQCFFPSSPQQWNEECTGPYSNTKPREWAYPGRAVTPASFPRSKKISIWNTVHICTIFSSCVLIYCYLVIFSETEHQELSMIAQGMAWGCPGLSQRSVHLNSPAPVLYLFPRQKPPHSLDPLCDLLLFPGGRATSMHIPLSIWKKKNLLWADLRRTQDGCKGQVAEILLVFIITEFPVNSILFTKPKACSPDSVLAELHKPLTQTKGSRISSFLSMYLLTCAPTDKYTDIQVLFSQKKLSGQREVSWSTNSSG